MQYEVQAIRELYTDVCRRRRGENPAHTNKIKQISHQLCQLSSANINVSEAVILFQSNTLIRLLYIPDFKGNTLSLPTETNYNHICINLFDTNIFPMMLTVNTYRLTNMNKTTACFPDKHLATSDQLSKNDISFWDQLETITLLQWQTNKQTFGSSLFGVQIPNVSSEVSESHQIRYSKN